jgi:hypothetical protein
LRRLRRRQLPSNLSDIVLKKLIVHDIVLLPDLLRRFSAEFDVLLLGEQVHSRIDGGARLARSARNQRKAGNSGEQALWFHGIVL